MRLRKLDWAVGDAELTCTPYVAATECSDIAPAARQIYGTVRERSAVMIRQPLSRSSSSHCPPRGKLNAPDQESEDTRYISTVAMTGTCASD